MFGASCPLEMQEKGQTLRISGEGGLRGPKILYAEILCVLYLHLSNIAAIEIKFPGIKNGNGNGNSSVKSEHKTRLPP